MGKKTFQGLQNQGLKVNKAQHFLIGFLVAALPVVIFSSAFGLSLPSFGAGYALVTVASAVLLALAYGNVAVGHHARLSSKRKNATGNHKSLGLTASQLESIQSRVNAKESNLYSFLYNNLIFAVAFLFISFYVLQAVAVQYNYIASMVVSSAIVWQLSHSLTH